MIRITVTKTQGDVTITRSIEDDSASLVQVVGSIPAAHQVSTMNTVLKGYLNIVHMLENETADAPATHEIVWAKADQLMTDLNDLGAALRTPAEESLAVAVGHYRFDRNGELEGLRKI